MMKISPEDSLVFESLNNCVTRGSEAVRVARSGYPVRLPHQEVYSRYRALATETLELESDMKEMDDLDNLVKQLWRKSQE